MFLLRRICTLVCFLLPAVASATTLENPQPWSSQSGIGAISGWVCDARQIEIEFNNDAADRWQASYGTRRTDTQGECGDTDNGFGLLFNWNKLGDGVHTVRVFADGSEFAQTTVTVTTLGQEFFPWPDDYMGNEVPVLDFPTVGAATVLHWQESLQNFVITAHDRGEGPLGLEMVRVPGGSFTMGCIEERDGICHPTELPAHQVRVSGFEIGQYEVTQKLWVRVMGRHVVQSFCASCPVAHVTWYEIQEFLRKLNAAGGRWRLPSEAEWEYAARGGDRSRDYKYAGSNSLDAVAWYEDEDTYYNDGVQPVGQKQANELGLYDMSGNASEWVQDCWNFDYMGAPSDGQAWNSGICALAVVRGGGLYHPGPYLPVPSVQYRSAFRDLGERWWEPNIAPAGFRLARSLN